VNSQVWWYVARASGVVAWGLITGAVVLGLWLSLRLSRNRPRPAWTLDLHRFLGGLAVAFTGVHLAGLVADSYVSFGATELFVPFASSWRPTGVALGVIGVYLLVAIEITSLLMRRLPRRLWRGVHLTSYVLFVLATAHMLVAGTDAGRWALQWTALGGTATVAFFTVARLLATRSRQPRAVTATRRPDVDRAAPARTRPELVATAPR
jgi:DMSO/TMAO reductase YedYZ heme-binding membrane subunit